jgi:histidinol dehydrogenase
VTAAKLLVSSRVAIDLPAGPSEVVVVADATADPARCAGGLLAQAEHGPDSVAVLLTPDAGLSGRVASLVAGYENVRCELVDSVEAALARSEELAPEHLELHVARPDALVARVRNAGSVFVGTSAVVGDYAAGATHVLPTGGLARAAGGLGLETFLKPLQVVRATEAGIRTAREVVEPLARVEGLPLHAAALGSAVRPGAETVA